MEEQKKKYIIEKSIHIINNKITPFEDPDELNKLVTLKGLTFLVKDYKDYYEELINDILDENGWKENFSEKYVEKFIDDLISDIIRKGAKKVATNSDLVIGIFDDYFHDVIVYIPIDGIEMKVDELEIGNATLKKMTDKKACELADKMSTIFKPNPHYKPEFKKELIKKQQQKVLRIKGRTYVEFSFLAGERKAIELAEKELEKVFDILNYSISYLYHKDFNVSVGMQGEIKREIRDILVFKSNFKSWFSNSQLIGPTYLLEISPDNIKKMEKIGVFKLSDISKKADQDLTEFEYMLIFGLHWFADSQKQILDENEFMSLSNCLELFLKPNKGHISSFIAHAVNELLNILPKNRNIVKKRINNFYNTRSDITHGRLKNLLKKDIEEELNHLRPIVRTLLRILINKSDEFENKQSLLDWLEILRYKRYNDSSMFLELLS